MPYMKRSHEEARKVVCLICLHKSKDIRLINSNQKRIIQEHVFEEFNEVDDRLPSVLCGTCRLTLSQYDKGIFSRKLYLTDHSSIPHRYYTRSQSVDASTSHCLCIICEISRGNPVQDTGIAGGGGLMTKAERGRPATSESSRPTHMKLCGLCLSQIMRGKPHNCSISSKVKNVKDLSSAATEAHSVAENVAALIIKEKIKESDANETELSVPGGGHPLRLTIPNAGNNRNDPPHASKFKHSDMSALQVDLDLSTRETLKLGKHLRSASSSRKIIEPHLKLSLNARDHELDEFFDVKYIDFIRQEGGTTIEATPRWAVICKNVSSLIRKITTSRGYTSDTLIKIGIDGGGGFFKISLSVVQLDAIDAQSDKRRRCYAESPASQIQESSVKRLMLLAVVPEIQENYCNLLKLWTILDINQLEKDFVISADLKICNILLGLMPHGATHPCCWCDAKKGSLQFEGNTRTFQGLQDHFWNYVDAGREKKQAKLFDNVIHPSIVKPNDLEKSVLDVIPPPELHLFLGPVNTIYNALTEKWKGSSEWLKRCHVEREAFLGGSFTGNSCKILLNNVDLLRSMCPIDCLPYVDALQSFSQVSHFFISLFCLSINESADDLFLFQVVASCYGSNLSSDFGQRISQFKQLYLDLAISVTPKLHAIFYHIPDFCRSKQRSLAQWSEQVLEAMISISCGMTSK